jgi:choline kinase
VAPPKACACPTGLTTRGEFGLDGLGEISAELRCNGLLLDSPIAPALSVGVYTCRKAPDKLQLDARVGLAKPQGIFALSVNGHQSEMYRMRALMLAAGLGSRLGNSTTHGAPKVLLPFGGESLLSRHIGILKRHGIDQLVLGVGFNKERIEQEIAALGAQNFVTTVFNPDFDAGSIVTLWTLREEMCRGGSVLLMDADVLYHEEIVLRLATSSHRNCLLLDRNAALDDEAVKVCVRNGEIVEFRKWVSVDADTRGESVGFFKLSASGAKGLMDQTQLYIEQGRHADPYEEPVRDVLLTSGHGVYGYEDITGLPWIEIDTADDFARARSEVFPLITDMIRT